MSKNGNLKFKNENAITDTEKGNARRRRGPDATDADLSKEFDDRTIGPFVVDLSSAAAAAAASMIG